ncbi:TolB-like translocation protein, partial [Streptomyces europaeiscabiei]|uniref:hypothetical protein n=1 Tax=Streptomyces europaeiscabiei TaxID=146819 RepID=UPI0038F668F0
TLVSASAAGLAGNAAATSASVADDGRLVAFESDATTLVTPALTPGHRIFVKDSLTGAVTAVAIGTRPQLSGDGRWLVFDSDA